jgi:hypothetical protein
MYVNVEQEILLYSYIKKANGIRHLYTWVDKHPDVCSMELPTSNNKGLECNKSFRELDKWSSLGQVNILAKDILAFGF